MRLPRAPLRTRAKAREVSPLFPYFHKEKKDAADGHERTVTKKSNPHPPLLPPRMPKAPPVFLTWVRLKNPRITSIL